MNRGVFVGTEDALHEKFEAIEAKAGELRFDREALFAQELNRGDCGEPLYSHDCASCVYLGVVESEGKEMDLWVHWSGFLGRTVIARHGNSGEDYVSVIGLDIHALDEALFRAAARGVIPSEVLIPAYVRRYVALDRDCWRVLDLVESAFHLASERHGMLLYKEAFKHEVRVDIEFVWKKDNLERLSA